MTNTPSQPNLLHRLEEAERERDEALDRVDELERDAETVSTEFEKDCWIAMRALLESVGWTDFSEGVTANDAQEIVTEAFRDQGRALSTANARIEELSGALKDIEAWRLPATGQFWNDDESDPVSYETAYGSNGARDYIRSIARTALTPSGGRDEDGLPEEPCGDGTPPILPPRQLSDGEGA